MSDLKYCNYCDNCKGHQVIEVHTFGLLDYIAYKMPSYTVLYASDDCARVKDKSGNGYDVYFIGEEESVEVGIVSIDKEDV